ncbi:MAG TPA: hypothetical protein VNB90_16340 [Cytophagaceae bacterium]|jgi:hypothetical protein|nr:hypothetical protein [Cytophagaceae bacterium]
MHRLFLILLFLLSCFAVKAQQADTIIILIPRQPFIKTMYVRTLPLGIYTGAGYPKDRITQNLELGKTFGIVDAGIAYGRTALRSDSAGNGTHYLEGKITMNLCQVGIFSNEMTVGAGGIFHSDKYLMLELSYTIYAQFWDHVGIGIVTGYYDLSGNITDASHNVFGLYLRFGLIRPENGGLLNLGRMSRTHGMRRR